MTDFITADHGSIVILIPASEDARYWVDDNLDPDAMWFGKGVAIEPRYVADIIDGITADGLTVG